MMHHQSSPITFRFAFIVAALVLGGVFRAPDPARASRADRVLWSDVPAENWEKQALPIGNGRLGCMVFGGVDREHIQFNEDTLWIGDEKDTGAYQAFGDLFVELNHANPQHYRRQLDLDTAVQTRTAERGVIVFATQPGKTYQVAPKN